MNTLIEEVRNNIVGVNSTIQTPYGTKNLLYADWIATGRLYFPIENFIINSVGPYFANSHSEASEVGYIITDLYLNSKMNILKKVNGNEDDIIIPIGNGMTGAINKLQSILGLKNKHTINYSMNNNERPVVFISQYEHNSNYISWLSSACDVEIIDGDANTIISFEDLNDKLHKYKDRKIKIGSFSAASNVTGTILPYKNLSKIMHENNGFCFVDFAASAPYVNIDMHPDNDSERLDAIFFSPHKFLGGPGSCGILIFNSSIYLNPFPDSVGGGIVNWVNPWGDISFINDISSREDAGTPGIIQTVKASLCMNLKEYLIKNGAMDIKNSLMKRFLNGISKIPEIQILDSHIDNKIGIVSFSTDIMHYNLFGKILSDRFGIQIRCGCLCASILAHNTFKISKNSSTEILNYVKFNNFSKHPGFIRFSIHPTMTIQEIDYMIFAIEDTIKKYKIWKDDYHYVNNKNEFKNKLTSKNNLININIF